MPQHAQNKTHHRNILITGMSGMIGTALAGSLAQEGYTLYGLNRGKTGKGFRYDAAQARVYLDPDIPLYGVINLAGANIADKRWSTARKAVILQSRKNLTLALSQALADSVSKPRAFLSASAIGFYGDTGDRIVTESSPRSADFLAQVAGEWEQATASSESAGIPTTHLRFGIVLSPDGGVLKQLLLPFKLGAGGRIGDGRQYLSWISLHDVQHIVSTLLHNPGCSGPLNVVAAEPVTNALFTKTLAHALRRPAILPLPAALVKLLFGEMGEALLLGSSRVQSERMAQLGISLQQPTLPAALAALLRR